MYLSVFKSIREKLLSSITGVRYRPGTQKSVGVGAGGDKTFPIDRLAEDIIISELEASGFPLSVISEEYGHKEINGGGNKVLIDPVDGSKNAISGIPFYCTSIAIAEGNTIGSISTVYVVNLINGDEFRAEKNKGTFLNGERVSTQKDEEFYLVSYEAQSPANDIARILPLLAKSRKTRCLGATALDLAYLSCGAISIFVTPSPSRSFDFAGGWLLVKEAGGMSTDLAGRPLDDIDLGLNRSAPLLSSGNERLHEEAMRLLV